MPRDRKPDSVGAVYIVLAVIFGGLGIVAVLVQLATLVLVVRRVLWG